MVGDDDAESFFLVVSGASPQKDGEESSPEGRGGGASQGVDGFGAGGLPGVAFGGRSGDAVGGGFGFLVTWR